MTTELKRSVKHLISETMTQEKIECYFQAIEDLFKPEYLNSEKALGPLPILWKRTDALATNELFALGKSIHSLQIQNKKSISDWLDSTAKTAKKHAKYHGKSEGFIREIMYCGSAFDSIGEIIPARKAQQAYDLEIKTANTDFIISLKKFGKSDKHREFENYCHKLAEALQKKAADYQINISLLIFLNSSFNEGLFKSLLKAIINSKRPNDIQYYRNGHLVMASKPLIYPGLSPNSGCWQLNVFGPESKNEQSRFVKQIIKEISNIKKTLDSSSTSKDALRTLYVHVHENCDMDLLEKRLQEHYEGLDPFEDLGVDFVILQKSAVCQSQTSDPIKGLTKEIIHDIRPLNIRTDAMAKSAISRLNKYIKNGASQTKSPLKFDGLVGSFCVIPTPVITDGTYTKELKNQYDFQKGVYRFNMIQQEDGSYYADLPSAAPKGITCEIFIPNIDTGKNSNFLVSSKIMSPHDDLLII
jgi:hypothetical protein